MSSLGFTIKMAVILPLLSMIMALRPGVGGLNGTSAPPDRPFCLSDELLSQSLQKDRALQTTMEEQERAIRHHITRHAHELLQQQTATSNFTIPVVVYIIHDNGAENISRQQISSQITALNSAFSGHGIQFCLATQEGSTPLPGIAPDPPGIIRIQSSLTYHLTSQESSLKALSSLPGDRYLRIWVVKDIDNNSGVAGYARFPGSVPVALEGIVMRYDVFGDLAACGCSNLLPNYDQGKILAHEAGHYLNLYHTFQGGCTGVLPSDCAAMGDRVCDTPQIATADSGCPSAVASCDGTPALLNNEMDYTNDLCRNAFTAGQESRMLAAIGTLRELLVSPQNLVFTGVQCTSGLNASFAADNYNPCKNQVVTFDAINIPGATYAWDFGDASTGAGDPATHSYPNAGAYNVTLTVTSGAVSVSSTQQVFVTACAPLNSSQGNWYFGTFAGLNFSSGSPLPALGAFLNTTIATGEGCATQSDVGGNLLFYSDGIRLWDKTHVLLNPTTPLTGHNSSSQSALSVPVPGSSNQYYLFTIPSHQFDPSAYFAYSIVDVTGGNVSLLTPNTPVPLPAGATSISEAATAVQKCNGDYWVIVRGYWNDPAPLHNSFYVYSATASGVTLAGTYPLANRSFVGQLKMSPDGALLACSGGAAVICDFDRAAGVLSNPKGFNKGDYGITFSPDSHVFYIADFLPTGYLTIYQYDLLGPNPASTEHIVATTPQADDSSLQIGPDQKVYMALIGQQHLAVINFPNKLVSTASPNACGFSYFGPSLVTGPGQGIASQLGLPNMIDGLPPAQVPVDFAYVTSSCSTVSFSAPACATYAWNFGDSTTSNVQDPTHTYAANGTYTVNLTLNGITTVTHTVAIGVPASSATIFGPSGVCLESGSPPFYNYSANAQPGLTYSWAVTGGAISGFSTGDNIDVVWNALPGSVQLTVTDSATGCSTSKTLTVSRNCNPNQCIAPPSLQLGAAGNYTVLGLNAAKLVISEGGTNITGDVGLGGNGTGSLLKVKIDGTLFLDPTAHPDIHNDLTVTGGAPTIKSMSAENAAALAANTALGALSPTQTLGAITSSGTITGTPGTNVIRLAGVNMVKGSLTISGPIGSVFIINVTGGFNFSSSQMVLSGGVQANNIIWNFIGAGADINIFKPATQAYGTFLAPYRNVIQNHAALNGRYIGAGGLSLTIHSAATVICPRP